MSQALFLSLQVPSSCQTKPPAPACRPTGTWGLRAWESKPVLQRRPCVWRNTHPLLPNPSKSPHCSALRRRLLTRGPAGADAGGPLISSQAPYTMQGGTQGPRQERSVLRALCPLADLCPPEPPSLRPQHPRPRHLLRQQGEPGGHQDKNWRRPPWGCASASESEAIGKMPLSRRLPGQAQKEDGAGDTGLLSTSLVMSLDQNSDLLTRSPMPFFSNKYFIYTSMPPVLFSLQLNFG